MRQVAPLALGPGAGQLLAEPWRSPDPRPPAEPAAAVDSPAAAVPSTPVAVAELARADSSVSADGGESAAGGVAGEQPKRRRPREAPAGWHE